MEIYRIYVTGNGSQTNHQESGDFFVRNMQFPFAWGRYDSLEQAQKDFDHELILANSKRIQVANNAEDNKR